MKQKFSRVVVCSAAMLLASSPGLLLAEQITPVTPDNISKSSQNIPTDRIIVRFKEGSDELADVSRRDAKLDALSRKAGKRLGYERGMSGRSHVLSLGDRIPEHAMKGIIERMKQEPGVESVEPDAIMQMMRVPNDTFYSYYQWHYQASTTEPGSVNLPAAWDITTGDSNIVVGVIDTGILPHADLAGRTVPGYDFISTAFVGNDGDGRDSNPTDSGDWTAYGECYAGSPASYSSWHGTHVAGTIGASSNNSYGVAGVNWVSKILPARVLGKCGGYTSDIADAIRWTAGLPVYGVPANANPAQVINMSLGGGYACTATSAMQLAINDAVARGTVVVVAAGNSNMDAANFSPASCSNVVTVAANNRSGNRTYYSNYGATVEIAAPGGEVPLNPNGILSTLDTGAYNATGDNVFAFYQGTSMAAPHVTGVVSLMASANYAATGNHLLPSVLMQKLVDNARPFPSGSTCSGLCGRGIADATLAVRAVSTAPSVNSGADLSVGTGELVALNGTVSDDGSIMYVQWTQIAGPAVALSGVNSNNASFTTGTESTTLTFRLDAVDDVGLISSDTVNIVVTAPPPPAPEPVPEPAPAPAPEPTPVVNTLPVADAITLVTEKNTPVSATFTATDADGDSVTYSIISMPTNGSVSFDAATGAFTYTPNRRYTGSDSFIYVASDAQGSSAPASVSVTINGTTKTSGGGSTTKKGGRK